MPLSGPCHDWHWSCLCVKKCVRGERGRGGGCLHVCHINCPSRWTTVGVKHKGPHPVLLTATGVERWASMRAFVTLFGKPGDSLSTYGAHATGSPQWVAATHPSQVLKKNKSDCAVPSGPPCDRGVTLPAVVWTLSLIIHWSTAVPSLRFYFSFVLDSLYGYDS